MTQEETISLILLATAIASKTELADLRAISKVAEGINHSMPKQKESEIAIGWLVNTGLVRKHGTKYALTSEGQLHYEEASKQSAVLYDIWDNLLVILEKYDK
jgi:hypothetical protein